MFWTYKHLTYNFMDNASKLTGFHIRSFYSLV